MAWSIYKSPSALLILKIEMKRLWKPVRSLQVKSIDCCPFPGIFWRSFLFIDEEGGDDEDEDEDRANNDLIHDRWSEEVVTADDSPMDVDDNDSEQMEITKTQLAETIQKCRSLIKSVNRSQILTSFMNTERTNLGVSRRLMQDCITRWNSTFSSLQSLLLNKQVILNLFANKRQLPISAKLVEKLTVCELSSDEWVIINQIVYVLKPFYEATQLLSGSHYPTIGLCFFAIRTIKDYLEMRGEEESNIAVLLKTFLLDSLNCYFDEADDQFALLRVSTSELWRCRDYSSQNERSLGNIDDSPRTWIGLVDLCFKELTRDVQ